MTDKRRHKLGVPNKIVVEAILLKLLSHEVQLLRAAILLRWAVQFP